MSAGDSSQARPAPRRVTILGATGSIGASTADVVAATPERFDVVAVAGGSNAAALARCAKALRARLAVIAEPEKYSELADALSGSGIEAAAGPDAVVAAAELPTDMVVAAIVGIAGLAPVLAAIRRGTAIALANKEALVTAGALVMAAAERSGATILPVDSEHNAIFQALAGVAPDAVETVILTASGGPFRTKSLEDMRSATPEEALRHPNWTMGAKVTIDSATLMNKGLELIEAHHLFAIPPEKLDVLVHPQSIVHGLVNCRDGSVIAQLAVPDMRIPIGFCLHWPQRAGMAPGALDLARLGTLSFERPDIVRFPALALAQAAMRRSGGACAALNGANEVAVRAFLDRRIPFLGIVRLVEETLTAMDAHGEIVEPENLDDVLALDGSARRRAGEAVPFVAANAL